MKTDIRYEKKTPLKWCFCNVNIFSLRIEFSKIDFVTEPKDNNKIYKVFIIYRYVYTQTRTRTRTMYVIFWWDKKSSRVRQNKILLFFFNET